MTLKKYTDYLEDAFLIRRTQRYDIKGKKYINSLVKYYFEDVGIRNAKLSFRQIEENHLMENIIYNELRNRDYRVDVGMVESFGKNVEGKTIRKQYEIDFVASRESMNPRRNEQGIVTMGILNFLMDENSLEA